MGQSVLKILLSFSLLFSISSLASENEDLNRIKEGAKITLGPFHAKTGTFPVIITDEPAVGPNYAKVRDLIEAIEFKGGYKEFRKKLPKLKNTVFTLKKPLKLLSDQELEKAGLN